MPARFYLGSYSIVSISNPTKRFMFYFSIRKEIGLVFQITRTFSWIILYAPISYSFQRAGGVEVVDRAFGYEGILASDQNLSKQKNPR